MSSAFFNIITLREVCAFVISSLCASCTVIKTHLISLCLMICLMLRGLEILVSLILLAWMYNSLTPILIFSILLTSTILLFFVVFDSFSYSTSSSMDYLLIIRFSLTFSLLRAWMLFILLAIVTVRVWFFKVIWVYANFEF